MTRNTAKNGKWPDMPYDAKEMTRKIDDYAVCANPSDPYAQILKLIAEKEGTGQHSDEFQENYAPLLQKIPSKELVKDGGLLLAAATDKALWCVIEYLLTATDHWENKTVTDALLQAAEHDYPNTLNTLLENAPPDIPDARLLRKITEITKGKQTESVVQNYRKTLLGEGWQINEDYEIQRISRNPTIVHIFNFGANHVTTVFPEKNQVIRTDFKDLQNDAELDTAYRKLSLLSENPPPYRGKDTGAIRRIGRKNGAAL